MVEGKYLKYEVYSDRKNRHCHLCKYWVETSDPEWEKIWFIDTGARLPKKEKKALCFCSTWLISIWFWTNPVITSSEFLSTWIGYDIHKCFPLVLSLLNFTIYSHFQVLDMCHFFLSEKSWYCILLLGCNKQITWHSCLENYYLSKFQKIYFMTMPSLSLSSLFGCREHTECMGMELIL